MSPVYSPPLAPSESAWTSPPPPPQLQQWDRSQVKMTCHGTLSLAVLLSLWQRFSLSHHAHALSCHCVPPSFGSVSANCDCQLTLLVHVQGSWVMVCALFFLFNHPLHPLPLQARGFSLMSSHCQHALWATQLLDTLLQPSPLQPFQGMQVTHSNLQVSCSFAVSPRLQSIARSQPFVTSPAPLPLAATSHCPLYLLSSHLLSLILH